MIYVIKTQNKDIIVFDSILSFSEAYQGSVTSHPVEDGTKISDHVITENVKLKISGVVSDYNFWNPLKDGLNVSVPAYNVSRSDKMGKIEEDGTVVTSQQIIPNDYADNEGNSVKAVSQIIKEKLKAIQRNREFVTVLGYNVEGKDGVVERWDNCILTDLSFDTTSDSGYAVYPNISIEQVNVAQVKVTQAKSDKIIVKSLADQAAGVDGKGVQKGSSKKDGTAQAETKQEAHQELINDRDTLATARELKKQVLKDRGLSTPALMIGD